MFSFTTRRGGLALAGAITAGLLACAAGPASAASDVVKLPDSAPFPESVTSTSDGTLFASSISDGGVVRAVPGASEAEVFIKPGAFDTRSTFGVFADEKNGLLWVASNDASAIGLKGPSAVEGGWIKAFDLKTGEGKTSIKVPASPAVANDFAQGQDGSLYVTNVLGDQIFRLKPGAKELEVFVQDASLKGGLDGIAFGEDGALYVNTYMSGEMFRIEVKDGAAGKITKLKTSRPITHADALKPIKGGFLMIEGAGTLDHVTISGDEAKIETVKEFAGPTGVTVVGDKAWVSEGQLNYLSDPDKKGKKPESFQLRATALPAN